MNAVEVNNLHKNYAGENALRGVSFTVRNGILYGLIGADGAGKTTLIRILTTLIAADSGKAIVLGKDTEKDLHLIRSHIGYMPQRFSLYHDLSVRENLTVLCRCIWCAIRGKESPDEQAAHIFPSRQVPEQARSLPLRRHETETCALLCTDPYS